MEILWKARRVVPGVDTVPFWASQIPSSPHPHPLVALGRGQSLKFDPNIRWELVPSLKVGHLGFKVD